MFLGRVLSRIFLPQKEEMRKIVRNSAFVAVLIIVIVAYAFETQIRNLILDYQNFDLNKVHLEDMRGKVVTIPDGFRGYIVFYSDVSGCHLCMLKLTNLRELSTIYEEVGYFAVTKHRETRDEFVRIMEKYDIPGEYLVDPDQVIGRKLALSEHPALLFFDRHSKLLAKLPLNLEHEKMLRLFHIYINEM